MSKKIYVRDLMVSNIWKVKHSISISDTIRGMNEKNIGAAIIIDDEGHTCGIFTERDLLKQILTKDFSLESAISTVMTKNLVCAQLHDEIDSIPELMSTGGFRHVPVLDGFLPVGILSIRDVLKHYMSLIKQ